MSQFHGEHPVSWLDLVDAMGKVVIGWWSCFKVSAPTLCPALLNFGSHSILSNIVLLNINPHEDQLLSQSPEMTDSTAICHPLSFSFLNMSSSVSVPLWWHGRLVTADGANTICHLSPQCVKGQGLIFNQLLFPPKCLHKSSEVI